MTRLDEAFEQVERQEFLPEPLLAYAKLDRPIPIGYGQTNSQPYTVRKMLEWLDAHPGQKVLDIGSGSGWTTALLAYLVRPGSVVYGVERIAPLRDFGEENCRRLGLHNVHFFPATLTLGLPAAAPYDRILVGASAHKVPNELAGQLGVGGIMVIPVESDIVVVTRTSREDYRTEKHPGFIFVPLK